MFIAVYSWLVSNIGFLEDGQKWPLKMYWPSVQNEEIYTQIYEHVEKYDILVQESVWCSCIHSTWTPCLFEYFMAAFINILCPSYKLRATLFIQWVSMLVFIFVLNLSWIVWHYLHFSCSHSCCSGRILLNFPSYTLFKCFSHFFEIMIYILSTLWLCDFPWHYKDLLMTWCIYSEESSMEWTEDSCCCCCWSLHLEEMKKKSELLSVFHLNSF